jgi:hypothetical protein
MALNIKDLFTGVKDHALASGLFARVNGHEPKGSPGSGITCAVWVDSIDPAPRASGMAATAGRVVFMIRVFTNMLAEPQDGVDPEVVAAVDGLLAAYSGDFDLGARVRNVDLLGEHGVPLRAQAGYVNVSGSLYRVMDVTLPLIINDLWTQGA